MPAGAHVSNTLIVTVTAPRALPAPAFDSAHRIGMDWEPWFTPLNVTWTTAEAVPLLDRLCLAQPRCHPPAYPLAERHRRRLPADRLEQQHLGRHPLEREHPPGVDQLIASTTALMDTLAQTPSEGLRVPQVTLLGIVNGPPAAMSAVNEELQFVHDLYIAPPKYRDLWVPYLGKPLIVVLNTQGPAFLKDKPPIDEAQFTIRWMSTLLEHNDHAQAGFWSWMDGVLHPVVTRYKGAAEALTITPAFFGVGGWTYPAAMGRRGGATYVEQFRFAAENMPRFRR